MTPKPTELHGRMRALLDAEADALDAATLSRLNRARQAALDAGLQSRRQFWRGAWMLLPASACGLLVWLAPLTLPVTPQAGPSLTELEALLSEPVGVESELLASDAPLELIDEWEFYAWLEQQPDADRS